MSEAFGTDDPIEPTERPVGTVLAAAITGAALVPLNSTMIAVAIPDIRESLHVVTRTAGLLVLGYLVVTAVVQPVAGRLGDRHRHDRVALVALVGFGVASTLAAVASSFAALAAARCLQALFGAAVIPNVQVLVQSVTTPATRGRIFGWFGSGIGAGAAAGPLVGGVLVAWLGWRATFAVNLPFVVLALVLLVRVGPPTSMPAADAPRAHHGGALRQPGFLAACVVQGSANLGQYIVLLVVPIVLDARGWSSRGIGLVLTALTISLLLLAPLGGRIGDNLGRRAPVMLGMVVLIGGLSLIAAVAEAGSTLPLVVGVTITGIGTGLAMASLQAAAMESVDPSVAGTAAGLLHTSRYIGSIAGTITLSALLSDNGEGAQLLVLIAAVIAIAALVASRWLPGRVPSRPAAAVTAEVELEPPVA